MINQNRSSNSNTRTEEGDNEIGREREMSE
jgi:hypothetical protein